MVSINRKYPNTFIWEVACELLKPLPVLVEFHPQIKPDGRRTRSFNTNPRIPTQRFPVHVHKSMPSAEVVKNRSHFFQVFVQSSKIGFVHHGNFGPIDRKSVV